MDFESLFQTPKGTLQNDPQSGSILRVLMENGFQEKIQSGFANGHRYTILHAAPSPDFTLVDTWEKEVLDVAGKKQKIPQKSYQFFKIIPAESTSVSEEQKPVTPIPGLLPQEESEKEAVPEATTPEQSPDIQILPVSETHEVAEKQEIQPEAVLIVPESPTEILESQPLKPTEEIPQKTSLSLLQEKFSRKKPVSVIPPALKQYQDVRTNQRAFQMSLGSTVLETTSFETTIKKMYENSLAEWEQVKTMPLLAFLYPEKYQWGTDPQGQPIFHSVSEYPEISSRVRTLILEKIETHPLLETNQHTVETFLQQYV